jgi:hypothetical protein
MKQIKDAQELIKPIYTPPAPMILLNSKRVDPKACLLGIV